MTVRELLSTLIHVKDLDREVNIYSTYIDSNTNELKEREWEIDYVYLNTVSTYHGKVIHKPHPKVFIEIIEDEPLE